MTSTPAIPARLPARSRIRGGIVASILAAVAFLGPARPAAAKPPPKPPEPPKTGVFNLPSTLPCKYVAMAVPKDYDPARFYPLLVILSSSAAGTKAEDFVGAWWDVMEKKGWILAAPAFDVWEDEGSVQPLRAVGDNLRAKYHVDSRRVALAGHNAGAQMAWRMATTFPEMWCAVLGFSMEIPDTDRAQLKKLSGKPAYIFRGAKDMQWYTASSFERDRRYLEAAGLVVTAETRPDWAFDLPRGSMPAIADWVGNLWPPGAYREKAAAVDEALKAKDLPGAIKAHADLMAELKKSPYPAFESRADDLMKATLDLGRSLLSDAKAMVEADPLVALSRMEAAAKAVKGVKALETEAAQGLVALRKDPKVLAAQKKKEAEDQAAAWWKRAETAEDKGDLARALECYRKVVSQGDTSKKADAEAKVAELEPKVGGGM